MIASMSGSFQATDVVLVVVIVVLFVATAGLALAETSLVRTSRARALALEDDGRRGARHLVRLIEHPEEFLSPVLLMVLICQLLAATLVGVVSAHLFGALGVVVATVFEVVVVFVLIEAVPKTWAVHHPDRAALLVAPFVSWMVRFLPVRVVSSALVGLVRLVLGDSAVAGGAGVTESELLAMADVAMEEEVIENEERALIHSVIEFGDTVVREVMVPRPDIVGVESATSAGDVLDRASAVGFSRIPAYDGNLDNVVGVAYVKDLVRADRSGRAACCVRDLVRPARFVPETKRVAALMREMQAEQYHLAVVVDEYGGTAGLVTLEDLIEELVGEIVDEFDVEEPGVERLEGGGIVVTGRMTIDDAADLLGAELPEGGWDTVGGLLLDMAGRVPAEGQSVTVDGFRLVAERVQGRRIARVRIEPVAPSGAAETPIVAD